VPSKRASILIVDDEFSIRDSLQHWFRKDYDVHAAESAEKALAILAEQRVDIALVDIKMPGMDGLELQERIAKVDPNIDVIIITAYATAETAVRALKNGAFDYVTKPIDPDEISHLVDRALEQQRLRRENVQLRETIEGLVTVDEIIGDSPALRKVLELVHHVAQTDATVLVQGESGTGKELIARAIHANSKRRYMPIIPVNCGAVPESLLSSELFGHEKGAFTGAEERRRGKLELADGGTLFLDEIGAIGSKMQVELLRALETKEFTRVGGSEPVQVDFRVICATNENLGQAIEEGRFREDFYYRINVFTIEAPPLRSRRSDIPLLAEYFRSRFAQQMDKRINEISREAMSVLKEYDWPGNVRELSNAIERAMVVGKPPAIKAADLPLRPPRPTSDRVGDSLEQVEKHHIAGVLKRTDWNITQAAKILEIDRVTVYNKIKKYGLKQPT
jgi:DNA-binding NtrC family response regulator